MPPGSQRRPDCYPNNSLLKQVDSRSRLATQFGCFITVSLGVLSGKCVCQVKKRFLKGKKIRPRYTPRTLPRNGSLLTASYYLRSS